MRTGLRWRAAGLASPHRLETDGVERASPEELPFDGVGEPWLCDEHACASPEAVGDTAAHLAIAVGARRTPVRASLQSSPRRFSYV
jgi:hypothetical protein